MSPKRQPPLMEQPTGENLPSPLFTGRPGWGGQLKEWLAQNAYVVTFRIVLAIAMALVVISIVRNRPVPAPSATPTPAVAPAGDEYRVTAAPGLGMTALAAQALDAYADAQRPVLVLSAEEHLFAVDALSRLTGWREVRSGEEVIFPASVLETIVSRARDLTPAQRAAWSRYLRP